MDPEILTFADWAKHLDANGNIDVIVELLSATNEVLRDMLVKQCNNGSVHKVSVRTGLPTLTWRKLNYGAAGGKGTVANVQDTVGMLEAFPTIDKAIADMNGNTNSFRLSQTKAWFQGASQQMAETLFYGDTTIHQERFMGLSPRYDDLSAASAANIVDAGGTGSDNLSIWFVTWADDATYGLFPKGSKAGLQHTPVQGGNGQNWVVEKDDQGHDFVVYKDWLKWDLGLSVADWRRNVRICNIDVSQLSSDLTYLKSLVGYMIEAGERTYRPAGPDATGNSPDPQRPRGVWYANSTARTALRKAILEKVGVNLTWETIAGERIMMFDGIPIRQCDALVNTESRVV